YGAQQRPSYGQPPQPPVAPYAAPQFAGAAAAGGAIPVRPLPTIDPHRGRRIAGFSLWLLGILGGGALNVFFQLLSIFASRRADRGFGAMLEGAVWALLPLGFYLFVPWIIDRYDPEPWWCLLMAFLWGALAATGGALVVNTLVEEIFGS